MALREFSYNVDFYQKALLEEFLAPRRCMREPVQALFDAADLLERAVDAHLRQDKKTPGNCLEKQIYPRSANGPSRFGEANRKIRTSGVTTAGERSRASVSRNRRS